MTDNEIDNSEKYPYKSIYFVSIDLHLRLLVAVNPEALPMHVNKFAISLGSQIHSVCTSNNQEIGLIHHLWYIV